MSPRISIIIQTLNEIANIERSVESALFVGDEVIVADGGSSDGTCDTAKELGCSVYSTARGRGQQLSAGAARASGQILLFLHADNWLAPEARSQILLAWQQAKSDAADAMFFGCFEQQILDARFIYRLIEAGNRWRAKRQRLPYGDQGMFVSRALYDSIGGMPEIPLMEDFEFSRVASRRAAVRVLDGPIYVDARRWEKMGPIRQTARNWLLAARYRLGAAPEKLVQRY